MVSFWPWGGERSSTSEFEKTLSTLSTKIATTQVSLDSTRTRARRFKVLAVLYLTFAYLVYVIVAFLVVGSQKMGKLDWTGVSGAPVVIYLIRRIITTFYDFRIDSLSSRLGELQAEREKTIQKLKDATKYDSTLELIEKYGGIKKENEENQPQHIRGDQSRPADSTGANPTSQSQPNLRRTALPPPPTANINRSGPSLQHPPQENLNHKPQSMEPSEEFAPNAFQTGQSYSAPPPRIVNHQRSASVMSVAESHWYDRILDLLLGEDEKDPKNRIVLICQKCRVVNGQAPPGVKNLAEIGIWKCSTCGTSNGEDEGAKIVTELLKSQKPPVDDVKTIADEDGKNDSL